MASERSPQLDEIVELLQGAGTMLMQIDAKLEDIVYFLGGEDDGTPEADA